MEAEPPSFESQAIGREVDAIEWAIERLFKKHRLLSRRARELGERLTKYDEEMAALQKRYVGLQEMREKNK